MSACLTPRARLLASYACGCTGASKGAGAPTPPGIPWTPAHGITCPRSPTGRGRAASARARSVASDTTLQESPPPIAARRLGVGRRTPGLVCPSWQRLRCGRGGTACGAHRATPPRTSPKLDSCGVRSAKPVAWQGLSRPAPHDSQLHIAAGTNVARRGFPLGVQCLRTAHDVQELPEPDTQALLQRVRSLRWLGASYTWISCLTPNEARAS